MKIKQIKDIFPDVRVARYNLAAWQKKDSDSVVFIGREVEEATEEGEPDIGVLKMFETDEKGVIVKERLLWKPIYEGINLEDPRALELPNDDLIIGLTAVLRDKKGVPVPFPAIVKIDSHSSWDQELPPILIVSTFGPGKNLTPLDNVTFLFRPDSPDYNHKILVFALHRRVPEKLADIVFPKHLAWAKWRVGTTMSPIWLNSEEALFLIHGITKQIIEGKEKYVYSIGRGKLTRKGNDFTVEIAEEPILTPDDFIKKDGLPRVPELHPELRRVVYSCGGIIKRQKQDTLSLYVNVGDRTTFEVEFSLEELKEGLF